MRKLFTLLLAVAASVGTMFAWDYERVQIGDLYYNLDATNNTAEVTSQNSSNPYWSTTITTANIPALVEYNSVTYSVTSIGAQAFRGCGFTAVTIPNSVTSIGERAFQNCSSLTSVTIPNSVTSIGDFTFLGCSSMTSITIPNSVTSIEYGAFAECSGLTSIEIPNSVTSIGSSAFRDCTGLTSVTIGNSVKSIGSSAFYGCSGLTGELVIPNSVTSIGVEAFAGCSGLTSVTIPNSVTSIGDYAFRYCTGLTSINIPNSVTSIGGNTFQGCHSGLTSVEAPAGFFDIPEGSWPSCTKILNHVTVNGGELTENALLFINRSYKTLQTLEVSDVTNTEFADEAFKGYYNLTELKLPADLQKVSYMMVAGCINLQSIDIPASVEEIDQRAFEDCRSIKTITFGENPSLIRIGNWAFYNCHELQNLEIPEGVTEIGDGAFYGCTYLKNLNLPASVQSIGDNGFAFCSKLQKMVVHAVTPPDIDYKTFEASSLQGGDRGRLIYHDGQIFILRGEKVYTLQGQEIK